MKVSNHLHFCAIAALVFATSISNAFASGGDPKLGSIDYAIAIPETMQTHLAIENQDNAVRYNFKKSDGTTSFLFSLNRIPEQQWLGVKDQLPNAKLCGHKNGFIYYAEITDKSKLAGPDKDVYASVYNRLPEIVRSVEIRN